MPRGDTSRLTRRSWDASRKRYARLIRSSPPLATKLLVRLPPVVAFVALGTAEALGAHAMAQPLALLAIMLAPVLLPRTVLYPDAGEPPPERPDGDDGGGPGPEPDPVRPPDTPRGGIPLPDAEPARIRLRDHDRPPLVPPRQRRPAREPAPAPRRAPTRISLSRR